MTVVLVLLLALLIGVVAGLRALTPPAVVAWAAALGWINLDGTWASWLAHPIVVGVLTILLIVEFVTDQLPKTPPRTVTPQFAARLITGAFAGAVVVTGTVLAAGAGIIISGIGAAMVGAVLGTLGGYQVRSLLVARNDGHDAPVAFLEDILAILSGFAVMALGSLI